MNNLQNINNVSKVLFILLVGVILYLIMLLILSQIFVKEPTSMADMMNQIRSSNNKSTVITLISLIIALLVVFFVSFYLFKHENKEKEYSILRKALSKDEKDILDEIKKAGEITQDSLRFRLDWSKAKISTILTNLDKRNLIQRKRTGKTYNVYLQR